MPRSTTIKSQTSNLEELIARLEEAEATLEAIRSGQVDALVGENIKGKQIYTLHSADYTYRILVESMDQGALTLSEDGIILYCNRSFAQMVNMPLERVTGSSITDFIDTKDQTRFVKWLKKKNKEKNLEFQLSGAGSRATPIFISICTLKLDSSTKVTSMIITDLTETKRNQEIEAARKMAEQQLAHERSERKRDEELRTVTKEHTRLLSLNKAKDEFISLASHQLRTPATAVKQYVGMLLDGYAGRVPSKQRKLLQTAYDSNDRQLNIVDSLLKVAQVDSGTVVLNKKKCDISQLLTDMVHEQTPKFKSVKQKLVLDVPKGAIYASIDSHLIRMALGNIIENAGKYSKPSQTINIALRLQKNCIVISVKDKGVGIDTADSEKLFRKFSRISNPLSILVGGSGLGLYWTKKIIDLHDGSIELKSKVNEGSNFIIKLPIKD